MYDREQETPLPLLITFESNQNLAFFEDSEEQFKFSNLLARKQHLFGLLSTQLQDIHLKTLQIDQKTTGSQPADLDHFRRSYMGRKGQNPKREIYKIEREPERIEEEQEEGLELGKSGHMGENEKILEEKGARVENLEERFLYQKVLMKFGVRCQCHMGCVELENLVRETYQENMERAKEDTSKQGKA